MSDSWEKIAFSTCEVNWFGNEQVTVSRDKNYSQSFYWKIEYHIWEPFKTNTLCRSSQTTNKKKYYNNLLVKIKRENYANFPRVQMQNISFRQRGKAVGNAFVFFHPVNTCVSSQSTKLIRFNMTFFFIVFQRGKFLLFNKLLLCT